MIGVSIVFSSVWSRIEPHLVVEIYDKDGGHHDPRIRIGFSDLPEAFGRELAFLEMACVTCGRPIHPLRRREGDDWSRLFYAPTCPLAVRINCSRSRAAHLEYERFKGIERSPHVRAQLSLF